MNELAKRLGKEPMANEDEISIGLSGKKPQRPPAITRKRPDGKVIKERPKGKWIYIPLETLVSWLNPRVEGDEETSDSPSAEGGEENSGPGSS